MSQNVVYGEAAGRIEYAKWICPTKRAYRNKTEAKAGAVKSLATSPDLPALYCYRCEACRMLHLTKKRKPRQLLARQPEKK
jgi:DNA primase large subunit